MTKAAGTERKEVVTTRNCPPVLKDQMPFGCSRKCQEAVSRGRRPAGPLEASSKQSLPLATLPGDIAISRDQAAQPTKDLAKARVEHNALERGTIQGFAIRAWHQPRKPASHSRAANGISPRNSSVHTPVTAEHSSQGCSERGKGSTALLPMSGCTPDQDSGQQTIE